MKIDLQPCGNQSIHLEYLFSIRAGAEKVKENFSAGPRAGGRPPLDRRILVVHIEKAGEKDEAESQEGREESDPFQNFQAGAGDPEKNDGDAQEYIPESVLQHEHPLVIKIAEPETRAQVPGC